MESFKDDKSSSKDNWLKPLISKRLSFIKFSVLLLLALPDERLLLLFFNFISYLNFFFGINDISLDFISVRIILFNISSVNLSLSIFSKYIFNFGFFSFFIKFLLLLLNDALFLDLSLLLLFLIKIRSLLLLLSFCSSSIIIVL